MNRIVSQLLHHRYIILILLVITIWGCQSEKANDKKSDPPLSTYKPVTINVPPFNKDSAYYYVKHQVEFGPRIPGSKAHLECSEWLAEKLNSYGLDVTIQKSVATTFDKKKFDLYNIIGSYNPKSTERILLCSHWDTRPFADRDEGENYNKPFDGANDGASGVGVLLEIARQISIAKPAIGIDIIFFDLEDYGNSAIDESWCLGAQYWAKNLHKPGYYARFGILLDMVGAKGATFPKEGTSMYYASGIVDKVWGIAQRKGYGEMFTNQTTSPTTDDHLYVNRDANIPCINIVHYNASKRDYFPHHHRVTDNMDNIDPTVLDAVGNTLLQVIFEENAGI